MVFKETSEMILHGVSNKKSCSKLHFSCIGIIYVYGLKLVLHIWLGLRHQDRKLIKSLFAWNNLNIIYQFTCE